MRRGGVGGRGRGEGEAVRDPSQNRAARGGFMDSRERLSERAQGRTQRRGTDGGGRRATGTNQGHKAGEEGGGCRVQEKVEH